MRGAAWPPRAAERRADLISWREIGHDESWLAEADAFGFPKPVGRRRTGHYTSEAQWSRSAIKAWAGRVELSHEALLPVWPAESYRPACGLGEVIAERRSGG
jgi:hypothetical protein